MAIHGYTKEIFRKKLGEVVSASHPVQSLQRLKGRESDLAAIDKALSAPGRHVFIYGDRGVGKSSLAASAAHLYQSADASAIFVSGSVDDTFKTVIANIVYQALRRPRTENKKSVKNAGLQWRGLSLGASTEVSWPDIASQIHSVGDAAELLKEVAEVHSENPIVVIDEFDTIKQSDERGKFASLLKVMGDQSIHLKFIFTGIGQSLDDLLGAHQSAHRQLLTHELLRLPWDGRREIVAAAAAEFGISVHDDINWRIAAVSDGFPYYVHLITEHMFWAAFNDAQIVTEVGAAHFHEGLREAVQSINAELKKPYEKAVLLREPEFEDIVWSTADADDLIRSLPAMFSSYKTVTSKRNVVDPVDRERYSNLIRKLKQPGYGQLLEQIPSRPGWYTYHQKMLRGYVRMQAEVNGVPLNGEREAPKQKMHIGNARHGYHGPSLPSGVRTGRKIDDLRKEEEES